MQTEPNYVTAGAILGREAPERQPAASPRRAPAVALAIPCYNEEESLEQAATELVEAFQRAEIDFELVLVDNGSRDRTGTIIDSLIARGLPIIKVHVPVNRGYGSGIRHGLDACRAGVIGFLHADGQVAARDVVHIYQLAMLRPQEVLAKARRRLRKDNWRRKLTSISYNGLMYVLFGWLGSVDLNGSPKLFSRAAYLRMRLVSDDWFLDPEIMIKAHEMGLQVIELNVVGQLRRGGRSHVRSHTVLEFVKNIVRYRWGHALRAWRDTLREPQRADVGETAASGFPLPQSMAAHERPARVGTLADVRELRQPRHVDGRGFLQKILTASQCGGQPPAGEVYVTAATQGQSKGHHYHLKMGEWFSVVQGRAVLYLADPQTGETQQRTLDAETPSVVYVPAGIAHALHNDGPDDMLCVAWAEREHDPSDVMPFRISIDS